MEDDCQFNSSDTDIIFRTVEATCVRDFYLHKSILEKASTVFSDMFTLPQEQNVDSQTLPIVNFPESEKDLENVLRCVYPIFKPIINSLDDLATALKIANTYMLPGAISILRDMLVLSKYLDSDPLRVYIIACCYRYEEEAHVASRYSLKKSIPPGFQWRKDLQDVYAIDYHCIVVLRYHRSNAAKAKFECTWRDTGYVYCKQCNALYQEWQQESGGIEGKVFPKCWCEFSPAACLELERRP